MKFACDQTSVIHINMKLLRSVFMKKSTISDNQSTYIGGKMDNLKLHKLGIDIGSTTVKIAILDDQNTLVFSDYERHFANIRETLTDLLHKAYEKLGQIQLCPMITGSGGLTLAKHLGVPFVQEVIAVSTALQDAAPQTDVAIELGGEDAKIIYFEGGNVEQRMNGICAGGTGSFIDQRSERICEKL